MEIIYNKYQSFRVKFDSFLLFSNDLNSDFISKESFNHFSKFLLKRLMITQNLKSKELYFTSPYDVNITTTYLMKRKAFFDLEVPRDCIFNSIIEDISNQILKSISLFKQSKEIDEIKKSTERFINFVGKDIQFETNNFNSIINGFTSKLELKSISTFDVRIFT